MEPHALPLGALIAGGRSRRYGVPKALERVRGERLVDRVSTALRDVTDRVVLITSDTALRDHVGLPARSDRFLALGPLGGVDAALRWAVELGRPGILAVACDLPFPSAPLLRRIGELGTGGEVDVVVPENPGNRRGIEPLFAFYSRSCMDPIERAIDRGDYRMVGFLDHVRVERVLLDEVRTFGDPARLFFNVNTRADLARAERLSDAVDTGP